MKKLLGIVVLGLLWCNVGVADEIIKIPVHVYIGEINEENYKTLTKTEDIEEDFKIANKIWAKANIVWDVKKIDKINLDNFNFKWNFKWITENSKLILKGSDKQINVERFEIFRDLIEVKKFSHKVINVVYLPHLIYDTCGTTFQRTNFKHLYSIIGHKEGPINKYKCPIRGFVLAHEIGHMMDLDHTKKKKYLMSDQTYYKTITFDQNMKQTKISKKERITVQKHWNEFYQKFYE